MQRRLNSWKENKNIRTNIFDKLRYAVSLYCNYVTDEQKCLNNHPVFICSKKNSLTFESLVTTQTLTLLLYVITSDLLHSAYLFLIWFTRSMLITLDCCSSKLILNCSHTENTETYCTALSNGCSRPITTVSATVETAYFTLGGRKDKKSIVFLFYYLYRNLFHFRFTLQYLWPMASIYETVQLIHTCKKPKMNFLFCWKDVQPLYKNQVSHGYHCSLIRLVSLSG